MKEELILKIAELTKEIRSIADEFGDASKDVNEINQRMAAKKAELDQAKKELAQAEMPVANNNETRKALLDAEELRSLAKGEVRSITIGSDAGAQKDYAKVFEQIGAKDDIVSKAQMVFGKDALTRIPVLNDLGDLTSSSEAITAVTVDTEAGIEVTELAPKAYARVLGVTAEALTIGMIDLEAKMQSIFDKAFRKAIHKGMLVGAGTDGDNMTGIFTSVNAAITAATTDADYPARIIAGGVSMANLAELAVAVSGLDEEYTIIMSPSVYAAVVADTDAGEDVKIYKESLIRDKMIENVKVIVDANAPSNAATAKKAMIVAAPLSRYCIGVAAQMNIDAIKVKGDKSTYFQGTAFFDGKQADSRDLYAVANSAV